MWRRIESAEGAKYDSQGQVRSEAEHVAPGLNIKEARRGLKGRNSCRCITPFSGLNALFLLHDPGATRFALAPGYHIPRLRRSDTLLCQRVNAALPQRSQLDEVSTVTR